MAVLTRITDFIPNTLIKSQEVDDELNQLVNLLSGVSTNKDTLLKYSHATDPVLRVDQLGAGVIQQWLQNGGVKSRINNNGSLESIAGPVIAASQLIAAPLTIDGATDIILKANGQIVGYPKIIHVNTAVTGNVGAGLDSLHSFSLPAGSLATDGDVVEFAYGGSIAANNNTKRVQVSIDGVAVVNSGLRDLDASTVGLAWWVWGSYIRASATTVRASGHMAFGNILAGTDGVMDTGNSRYYYQSFSQLPTVANLGSNAVTLLVQGEATSNDDVTQNSSIIKLTQLA